MATQLMIVDNNQLFVDGLKAVLAPVQGIEVCAEAREGDQALRRLEQISISLILMEMDLPGMKGLETTRLISTRFPGVRIMMLTNDNSGSNIRAVVAAGAVGYVLKHTGQQELLQAIKTVMSGKRYYSDEAAHQLLHGMVQEDAHPWHNIHFSRREQQVLKLIVAGYTNPQIAAHLHLGVETIRTHRKNLSQKAKARNVADLVRRAIQYQWVIL